MTEKQKYKLSQVIKYFIINVPHLSETKLYKLLFYLDFEHIDKYGFSVTGLDYKALPYGPVPTEIMSSVKKPTSDTEFKKHFSLQMNDNDRKYFVIKDDVIDEGVFSRNQLKLMEDTVFMYLNLSAGQISELSHMRNKAWDITRRTKGENQKIDFKLAKTKGSVFEDDEIEENIKLQKELYHYGDA